MKTVKLPLFISTKTGIKQTQQAVNHLPASLFACISLTLLMVLLFFTMSAKSDETKYAKATLAGGCFWCTEADMEKVNGVIDVVSGYAGGTTENPTYEDVSSGDTGHIETISVTFDPNVVSYKGILDAFLRGIDPTDGLGSFVDRGNQYRPAIFYHDETQRKIAEDFLAQIDAAQIFPKPLKVELIPFTQFWEAEAYHQDYYKNNSLRYRYYRHGSGRDQYLDEVFGKDRKENPKTLEQLIEAKKSQTQSLNKTIPASNDLQSMIRYVNQTDGTIDKNYTRPSDEEIRKNLTDLQYKVTQKDATERPFDNEYWNNEEEGIYVDIVSGEPLFSSTDKYDSGTGWPSFTKPIDENFITTKEDNSWFAKRIEVRSRYADSHLGHVFDDGPAPTGLRYCMNSASMRFIPKAELAEKGYGKYLALFNNKA